MIEMAFNKTSTFEPRPVNDGLTLRDPSPLTGIAPPPPASPTTVFGTSADNFLAGTTKNERIYGLGGFDTIRGREGNDQAYRGKGNDKIFGGVGNDYLSGYQEIDQVSNTGQGPIRLAGDDDLLDGGDGTDTLVAGDGKDRLIGGRDDDMFQFQWHDPKSKGDRGPGQATVVDFDPAEDAFAFITGTHQGGNFIAHNKPGATVVDTFYSGPAAGAKGEHVMVITDRGFDSGLHAATAISGEATGDIIAYYKRDGKRQAGLRHG